MNILLMMSFSCIGAACSRIFTFAFNGRASGSSIFKPFSSGLLMTGSEGVTKIRVY